MKPAGWDLVQNQAWALHPAKLQEITLLVEKKLAGEAVSWPEAAATRGEASGQEPPYQIMDGVAVLPVHGILGKRMNLFMRFSGGTSTEILARNFRQALADPEVQSILLDIDSPGGSIDGVKDLADLVFSARGNKPVVAYGNGLMASAAYWIGSAADLVVAGETALVGSIGVALTHFDYSKHDENVGVKRTVIAAGKYKRIASDEKPLSDAGQEYLQALVDTYYSIFVEAVARQRQVEVETVLSQMANGRDFIGKQALRAGLVDQLGNFETALGLARDKGGTMDLQTLQEKHPEVFQAAHDLGAASVTTEDALAADPGAAESLINLGRDTERERVMEILQARGPEAITVQAVLEGLEPKEAFRLMLEQQDTEKARALAELAAAAPGPVGQAMETYQAGSDSIEQEAQAEWDRNAEVRREFGQFDIYLAWRRAEAAGLVKISKKN